MASSTRQQGKSATAAAAIAVASTLAATRERAPTPTQRGQVCPRRRIAQILSVQRQRPCLGDQVKRPIPPFLHSFHPLQPLRSAPGRVVATAVIIGRWIVTRLNQSTNVTAVGASAVLALVSTVMVSTARAVGSATDSAMTEKAFFQEHTQTTTIIALNQTSMVEIVTAYTR